MANTFKDISQFTKKTVLTGTEEFQVSATEKVTAQQIADLASSGLNVYTVSESEVQNQKIDASRVEELKKSVLLLFPNEGSYTPYFKVSVDDSKAYFITGNIPINSQGQPGLNNGEEPPFEQVNTVMIEVDLTTYDITILPYTIINKSWLKGAVQVTAFTESALSALLSNYKTGDLIPFYTGNVTASVENQFPESGVFNGFISMGSNQGDYCQIFAFKTGSPNAYIGACIGSTTRWTQIGGSSAVEKLSTWLEQGTEVAPHINISLGEVQVPLNRALKESDILRIDFMRRSEASTFYMQGVAIVHVGAVDNSIQGYAAALDEQYVDYGTGEFAALAFNASTKLIGNNYFNLHIDTNGSVPQDDYYIMGVYNISGK